MKQQITKRAITESFRALLAVKPLDKITVRDIVEDCGLTRNTFYYHYEDIYDLLSDVLESEIERALSVPAGGASWETMLLDMAVRQLGDDLAEVDAHGILTFRLENMTADLRRIDEEAEHIKQHGLP